MSCAGATMDWALHTLRSLASPAVLRKAILLSCACFSVTGLFLILHWLATGESRWLDFWFRELGGPLLAAFALAEAAGAAVAARWFRPGELMGKAWRLLAAASVVHFASMLLRHVLGVPIGANPLHQFAGESANLALLREFGRVLGGTLYLFLLAAGLLLTLKQYWKLRLARNLSRSEIAVLAAASGFLPIRCCPPGSGFPGPRFVRTPFGGSGGSPIRSWPCCSVPAC